MLGRLKSKKLLVYSFVGVNVILLVVNIFLLLDQQRSSDAVGNSDVQYPLLSKRLFTEKPNDTIINFVPLRSSLRDYHSKIIEPTGIYFEYLPSGTSVGINSGDPFFGASLLKLPVAMKAYKLIEQGIVDKKHELTITEKNIDKGFGNLWQRGVGSKVTVDEVINLSITQSDNTADSVLRDLVQPRPVSDVFDYLDIETDVAEGPGAGVSPRGFASVLRALYLSAYLSYSDSNELLNTMTDTPYKDRLVAGVPKDVKVAHKVGIYKEPANEDVQVHSDCGIVYVPKRPYILCIMSDAKIDQATKYMSDISKLVYDYVYSAN